MKNLEIDEKDIDKLLDGIQVMITTIKADVNRLKNNEEDIFIRYLSKSRLYSLIKAASFVLELNRDNLINGHNIHHEILNTDEAKNSGWGEINLNKDSFFIQEEDEIHIKFKNLINSQLSLIKEKFSESMEEEKVSH